MADEWDWKRGNMMSDTGKEAHDDDSLHGRIDDFENKGGELETVRDELNRDDHDGSSLSLSDSQESIFDLNFAEDRDHLLSIFPEDVWYLLFDRLEESENYTDLMTLSNSSLYLRHLLYPRMTRYQFSSVWKVLGRNYGEVYKDDSEVFREQYDSDESSEGMPIDISDSDSDHSTNSDHKLNLYPRCTSCGRDRYPRWFSDILQLRLVCRPWTKAIDEFYQIPPQIFSDDKNDTAPQKRWIFNSTRCAMDDLESEVVEQFCKHFEKTHQGTSKSPLIGKSLRITYGGDIVDDIEENQFFTDLQNFLQKYGQHVENCTIEEQLGPDIGPGNGDYLTLQSWLKGMSNLKYLQVCCDPRQYHIAVAAEELIEMRELISMNPLPKLEQLDFLRTESLPVYTFNELIRSNNHISKLQIVFQPSERYDSLYSIPLPNLTELSIQFHTELEFHRTLNNYRINWSLRKLDVHVGCFCHYALVSWFQVFSVLQSKWGQTLTDLVLRIADPTEDFDDPVAASVSLHLPKLETLKLVFPYCYPLDFILPMKNTLEYLEVTVVNTNGVDKTSAAYAEDGKTIQLFTCIDNPPESNIWSLLPSLKRIKLIEDRFPCGTKERWTHHRCDWQLKAEKKPE